MKNTRKQWQRMNFVFISHDGNGGWNNENS